MSRRDGRKTGGFLKFILIILVLGAIASGTSNKDKTTSTARSNTTTTTRSSTTTTTKSSTNSTRKPTETSTRKPTATPESKEAKEARLARERENYINSCKTVSYSDVERNPSSYKGTKIKVSGKVIQVVEGWFNSVTLRVEANYNDIWYVTYTRAEDESRILEKDNITIYGECKGVRTYTTILGGSETIPSVEAEYIIIN